VCQLRKQKNGFQTVTCSTITLLLKTELTDYYNWTKMLSKITQLMLVTLFFTFMTGCDSQVSTKLYAESLELELTGDSIQSEENLTKAFSLELTPENDAFKEKYNELKAKLQLIKEQGFWKIDIEYPAAHSTNSKIITLRLDEKSYSYNENLKKQDNVSFIVRCENKQTQAYITWNEYLGDAFGNGIPPLTTQIGTNKPETYSAALSTSQDTTFISDPISFLKRMAKSDKLLASITPHDESTSTALFLTKGLENALLPLREVCGW